MSQRIPKVSTPIPARNAKPSTAPNGSGAASASNSGRVSSTPKVATSRICCGRRRSRISPPAISPADSAARISPQPRAPLQCSFEIAGPSTPEAPCSTALTTPNWSTIAQSHVREVNSRQPSERSAKKFVLSIRSVLGIRIAAVSSAATPNEAASIAIPVAGLVAWTTRPAIAPPMMIEPLRPSRSRAFAGCSFDSGTVCGTIPLEAGKKNAELAPATAVSAATCQICACPEKSRIAIAAWLAPETMFETTITRWRGSRSDQIPPTSRNSSVGIARAAST